MGLWLRVRTRAFTRVVFSQTGVNHFALDVLTWAGEFEQQDE